MSIFAANQWKTLINCVRRGSSIYQAHSRMPFVRCLSSDVSECTISQTHSARGHMQLISRLDSKVQCQGRSRSRDASFYTEFSIDAIMLDDFRMFLDR